MYACEDYPCCGHELNDCDGSKYGTDEAIWVDAWERANADEDHDYLAD